MARSDRLLELVQLLGGRRSRSLDDLAARFNVSARTVYRDLSDLSRRKIPVVRDEAGYRLLEGTTLRPFALTAAERAILRLALDNPALTRHRALTHDLELLRAKLDAVTGAVEETPRGLWLAGPDRTGPLAPGIVEALTTCVRRQIPADIDYVSLSGGTRAWRAVDPYAVFHRSEAWYLVGRCHIHDEPRLFRLDRIRGVRQSVGANPFRRPPDFNLERWLAGCWGVWRDGGDDNEVRHRVVLRFVADLAPLIEHARHYAGEVVERLPSGEIEYRVAVASLEEIARWVLGFGGGCVVQEPKKLREKVLALARGITGAHRSRTR